MNMLVMVTCIASWLALYAYVVVTGRKRTLA